MSIASEITRLNTAKADMKTSIENKGVTVSASAKIDTYAALIDSIPTGGGDTTHIVAVYNIESAGSTSILHNAGLDYVDDTMEVDGSTVSTAATYNFTTAGQHTIKFTPTGTAVYQLFIDVTSLISVSFPEGLTEIGSQTCNFCTALTDVVLPSTTTTIGNYCFESCTSLTTIKLPASVTSIGSDALNYCNALSSIYYYGDTLPTNQGSSHMTYEGGTVYVKAGVSTSPWETGSYNIITYWGYSVGYITEIKKDNFPINGSTTKVVSPTPGAEGMIRLVARGIGIPQVDGDYDILIKARFYGGSVEQVNASLSTTVYVDGNAHTISNGYTWPGVSEGFHWVGLNCAYSNKAVSITNTSNNPFCDYNYGFSCVEVYFLKVISFTGNSNVTFPRWRSYSQGGSDGVRNAIDGKDPFLLYISSAMTSMTNIFSNSNNNGGTYTIGGLMQYFYVPVTALIIEDSSSTLTLNNISFGWDDFLRYVYIGRNLNFGVNTNFSGAFVNLTIDELCFGPLVTEIGSTTQYSFADSYYGKIYCYPTTPPTISNNAFKSTNNLSGHPAQIFARNYFSNTFYYPSGADYSSWIGSGTSYIVNTQYSSAQAIL